MFIKSLKEATAAAKIATAYGFDFEPKKINRRYVLNIFSAWSNDADARAAEKAINNKLRIMRQK